MGPLFEADVTSMALQMTSVQMSKIKQDGFCATFFQTPPLSQKPYHIFFFNANPIIVE